MLWLRTKRIFLYRTFLHIDERISFSYFLKKKSFTVNPFQISVCDVEMRRKFFEIVVHGFRSQLGDVGPSCVQADCPGSRLDGDHSWKLSNNLFLKGVGIAMFLGQSAPCVGMMRIYSMSNITSNFGQKILKLPFNNIA